MPSTLSYFVTSTFEITGRGVVAAIDETVNLGVGKELQVTVTRPDGTTFQARAYQEWLLRRQPNPIEHTAFLLCGVAKSEVPIGSSLKVETNAL